MTKADAVIQLQGLAGLSSVLTAINSDAVRSALAMGVEALLRADAPPAMIDASGVDRDPTANGFEDDRYTFATPVVAPEVRSVITRGETTSTITSAPASPVEALQTRYDELDRTRSGDDAETRYLLREALALARDALIAAVRAEGAQGWQPIETAPKDGTEILFFEPVGAFSSRGGGTHRGWSIGVGYWHQPGNPKQPGFWCYAAHRVQRPTHWQPLPLPPPEAR